MDWFYQYELHYVVRLLVAALCGLAIGIERKNRFKEAGIRTHCMVACASALMMILSKYAFADVLGDFVKLDPARIAAGVVGGIGFLGAGMIFVHDGSVSGLTTAAGIWAVSGIGMAIGAGMYLVGLACTLILLLIQIIFHLDNEWFKAPTVKRLILTASDTETEFQDTVTAMLAEQGIGVADVKLSKRIKTHDIEYCFLLEIPKKANAASVVQALPFDCKLL